MKRYLNQRIGTNILLLITTAIAVVNAQYDGSNVQPPSHSPVRVYGEANLHKSDETLPQACDVQASETSTLNPISGNNAATFKPVYNPSVDDNSYDSAPSFSPSFVTQTGNVERNKEQGYEGADNTSSEVVLAPAMPINEKSDQTTAAALAALSASSEIATTSVDKVAVKEEVYEESHITSAAPAENVLLSSEAPALVLISPINIESATSNDTKSITLSIQSTSSETTTISTTASSVPIISSAASDTQETQAYAANAADAKPIEPSSNTSTSEIIVSTTTVAAELSGKTANSADTIVFHSGANAFSTVSTYDAIAANAQSTQAAEYNNEAATTVSSVASTEGTNAYLTSNTSTSVHLKSLNTDVASVSMKEIEPTAEAPSTSILFDTNTILSMQTTQPTQSTAALESSSIAAKTPVYQQSEPISESGITETPSSSTSATPSSKELPVAQNEVITEIPLTSVPAVASSSETNYASAAVSHAASTIASYETTIAAIPVEAKTEAPASVNTLTNSYETASQEVGSAADEALLTTVTSVSETIAPVTKSPTANISSETYKENIEPANTEKPELSETTASKAASVEIFNSTTSTQNTEALSETTTTAFAETDATNGDYAATAEVITPSAASTTTTEHAKNSWNIVQATSYDASVTESVPASSSETSSLITISTPLVLSPAEYAELNPYVKRRNDHVTSTKYDNEDQNVLEKTSTKTEILTTTIPTKTTNENEPLIINSTAMGTMGINVTTTVLTDIITQKATKSVDAALITTTTPIVLRKKEDEQTVFTTMMKATNQTTTVIIMPQLNLENRRDIERNQDQNDRNQNNYDRDNDTQTPQVIHVIEPSGYDGNGKEDVSVVSTNAQPIHPSQAIDYNEILPATHELSQHQHDLNVNPIEEKKLFSKLPIKRVDSSTKNKQKWKPFHMDCAKEVDERGGQLCSEWARGGLCLTHRATMFLFCRRTCLCVGPPGANNDDDASVEKTGEQTTPPISGDAAVLLNAAVAMMEKRNENGENASSSQTNATDQSLKAFSSNEESDLVRKMRRRFSRTNRLERLRLRARI